MTNKNQSSKINIFGSGNETKVQQIDISIFVASGSEISNELRKEIRDTLEVELINTNLSVLLCYPNRLTDAVIQQCITNLKDELKKLDAIIYEGGGKQKLPQINSAYSHISELDFIKKNCDSVVVFVFVFDELTLSQITLISYYFISKVIKTPDIIIIHNDYIKNLDKFFSSGIFQYCDDNNIKTFNINEIQNEKMEELIRRIRNKKLVSKNNGLLGG